MSSTPYKIDSGYVNRLWLLVQLGPTTWQTTGGRREMVFGEFFSWLCPTHLSSTQLLSSKTYTFPSSLHPDSDDSSFAPGPLDTALPLWLFYTPAFLTDPFVNKRIMWECCFPLGVWLISIILGPQEIFWSLGTHSPSTLEKDNGFPFFPPNCFQRTRSTMICPFPHFCTSPSCLGEFMIESLEIIWSFSNMEYYFTPSYFIPGWDIQSSISGQHYLYFGTQVKYSSLEICPTYAS